MPQRTYAQTYPIQSSGVTATDLMNKLLGPGVVAWGAVATCHDSSKGIFKLLAPNPNMFDSGIVMSSGRARTWNPTGGGSYGMDMAASNFANWDNLMPGAAWLGAITSGISKNACYFEFDFRPAGDTVKFDYVFGSEEYPGFTCTAYNDPFGFLISGPGFPVGGTNIALVPGTTIPVCINSINCGPGGGPPTPPCTSMGPGSPFCMYYINNTGGPLLTYDGITKKLQAIAAVTPCDTYHLKLGVSDISDGVLDSGVWLKAGSLTSTSLSINPVGMLPGDTISAREFCVRGCLPAKFVFTRAGVLTDSLAIHYVIAGSATNGLDYSWIPDSVVIPAGDSDAVVTINGLVVTPATGPKTVKLLILAPYSCGGLPVAIDSAVITIYDSLYVHISTPDTAICFGQVVHIRAEADTILDLTWAPPTGLSSTTIVNPTATPTVTMTYSLTGVFTAAPSCPVSKDAITITVYQLPVVNAGPDKQITCKGVPLQLNANVLPPGIPYTYSWSPTTYLSNATIKNPIFTPGDSVDRWQYVTVSAPVPGCSTTDTFWLHVLPNDFELYSPDTSICYPPGSYQIRALGDTEFRYHWTPGVGVSNVDTLHPILSPPQTIRYTVTGSYPGCPDMTHSIFYSIQHPQVKILTGDTTVCLRVPMPIRVAVTPPDSPYSFTWTPATNLLNAPTPPIQPYFFTDKPGNYTYIVEVVSGLGCKEWDTLHIKVAPPVKLIAQPPYATIKYGAEIQLEAIKLSQEDLFYTWLPNDGSLDNPSINNPKAKPLDSTTYTVYGLNQWGCRDTAYVTINVDRDMTEYVPSAFTPNGDGKNDIFRMRGLKYQRIVDFKIYNRWGEVVYDYKTGDPDGWDGTYKGQPMDIGVYNYTIILGKPGEMERIYKGNVTLIR